MRMLQIAKPILGSIWLFSIPKEPYSLVVVYPATLLCLGRCVVAPTHINKYFLVLAFFWDLLFGFWLMIDAMAHGRSALLRSLYDMKDCTYSQIPLSQLELTTAQREALDQSSVYNYLGSFGLPSKHEKDVEIFQVFIGPSNTIPNSLGVFHIPFIGSHIMVRDSPQDMEPFERFQLLHEIGHSLGLEFVQKSMLSKGTKSVAVVLILSLPMLQWSGKTTAFVALTVLAILLASRVLSQIRRQFTFLNEIQADAYALSLMTREEKTQLADDGTLPPKDSEIDDTEHLYRLAEYRKNLEDKDAAHPPSRLGRSSLRHHWFDQILTGTNLAAWMLLLSTTLKPADSHSLLYAKGLVGLLAVSCFVRWLKFYIGGLYAFCILHGYLQWRDDTFRWHNR